MQPTQNSRASQPTEEIYRQIRQPFDKCNLDSIHDFALASEMSAASGLNQAQIKTICVILSIFCLAIWKMPNILAGVFHWAAWLIFCLNGIFRLYSSISTAPLKDQPRIFDQEKLPTYSVLVALYKEAIVIPQLVQNLKNLNYPPNKLEIIFLLERDDDETFRALSAATLPPHFKITIVPEGAPKTKPRALNYGLGNAKGEYIVVYDAEDRPDRDQLLMAAHTFMNSYENLMCLQTPLRPVGAKSFIGKQFTLEYGLQFENLLPFLNSLGLPFPLGGTGNHFKADKLRNIGGWDSYNVTEDADLGLRLSRYGYVSGLIESPTYEGAPESLKQWLPQRTRWIKGYLQTMIVHLRTPWQLPPKVITSMVISIGFGTVSTLLYAPLSFLYISALCIWIIMCMTPYLARPATFPFADTALFLIGNISLIAALKVSSQRRSRPMSVLEALGLPIYWCLQSLAGIFAIHQLLTRPFHWDKTDHNPMAHADPNPGEADIT